MSEHWQTEPLGKYCYIKARIGWRGLAASEYTESGPFLIAGKHIERGRIDWDATDHISEFRYRESWEIALAEGDVILTKDGTIGRVARIDSLPGKATINGTMMLVRPERGIDYRFLYHVLNGAGFKKLIEDRISGSSIPHIFQRDMVTLPVSFPPIIHQAKLSEILDTLDIAIRETEAIIAKLKAIKQGLLHDLLTRGIDANGELRPPQAEVPHLYKESPLGWIPKEWDCVRLADKLAVLGGKRLPAGHAYADHPTTFKYLRVTDFYGREYLIGELENLHERTFKALARYEIKPEQLFISIAGSLGYVGVHRTVGAETVRTVLTENAARLVPLTELVPDFVAAYMNSDMVQSQVTSEKGTGGGVPKLALFRIEQFWLAWPAKDEQGLIAERLCKIDARISDETQLFRKLMLEKSGLMDDLLTGRVRVTPLLAGAQDEKECA